MTTHKCLPSVAYIQQKIPDIKPKVGIILGSGLGDLVNAMQLRQSLTYQEIPHFPQHQIKGHAGLLHLGQIAGVSIACMQGRSHFYEGVHHAIIINSLCTLRQLGCECIVITNSAGSLCANIGPGQLILISDHINFQFNNIFAGDVFYDYFDEADTSPFIGMENAYCLQMRHELLSAAVQLGIDLREGIYMGVLGPTYETPAETRAYASLGADIVGMSTIPEVIAARYCHMRVAAISVVTNFACGLNSSQPSLSHEHVLANAEHACAQLTQLLVTWLSSNNARAGEAF